MTEQQCECDPLDHGIDCPLRMTEQHECAWELILGRSKADCKTEGCSKKLSLDQIEHRLNEHASQRAEIETYKHEVSVLRQLLDDDGTLALEAIEQQEGEIQALRDYATHKPGCHENGEKCICGLDALLTSQEEPTKR